MIKVNNSGYGAFVQASGEIISNSITPVYQTLFSAHQLSLTRKFSLYMQYGNWFIYVLFLLLLLKFKTIIKQ